MSLLPAFLGLLWPTGPCPLASIAAHDITASTESATHPKAAHLIHLWPGWQPAGAFRSGTSHPSGVPQPVLGEMA